MTMNLGYETFLTISYQSLQNKGNYARDKVKTRGGSS